MAAVEVALRTLLVVVFGVAFVSKVRSRAAFGEFAASLDDMGWLRGPWRTAVAVCVPAAELAVVALLALPWAVGAGFAAGAGLLLAFTVVTGRELARGHRVRCRCFGAGDARIGPAQIARNIVLLGAAVAGLAIEPVSHGGAGGAGLALGFGLALLTALALVRWDDLAYLVRAS